MGEFLKILLSLSFSGAFLFLIVFLIVQVYRNRLSRRWQYYIWLLVVLRFLIPLTFPHTLTGYLFRGAEQVMEERKAAENADGKKDASEGAAGGAADIPENAAYGKGDISNNGPKENIGGQRTGFGAEMDSAALAVTFQEKTEDKRMPDFSLFIFGIWAAGALILLIRKITIYQSYMQFLRKGNAEVSDLGTLNLLAEAKERLRIKRSIELYRSPLITSPIMTGFFHPQIVIPDKKMTSEEMSCIFTHELVHFKYFDMFYKWLVQIALCVHWFNPFVYLLGKEVNKRCELSCDEKVIGAMNEQERKNYGDTLLSFLKRGETYENPIASITLSEGAEQLIERLGAIMDYQKKSRRIMILTTALTVFCCFLFSGIGAYAGSYAGRQDAEQKNNLVQQSDDVVGNGVGVLSDADDTSENQKEQKDIDYNLLYDEDAHTYYILIGGAAIADKPTGGVVDGIGIVLVRKSGYTAFTFNSFSVKFGFLDEVESQCQDAMKKGMISEAEAELIQDVAAKIATGESVMPGADEIDMLREAEELQKTRYSYFQQTYYKEPYMIEFGWNLSKEEAAAEIYAHTEVLLNDQSRMTVFFSEEAKSWMEDSEAVEAVSRLTSELKQEARRKYGIELELPYVSRIVYLPFDEIEDFAKSAFENDELANFAAVVGMLSEEVRAEYCERSYAEDDIAFFSIIISEMNDDYIREFTKRCYEKDDIDYFVVAADDLTEKDREDLMEKALQEGNDTYYYILKE